MSVHEGHRARMKKRFLENGAAGFEDHNLLELLLFYAQPRQSTNETAHLLLDTFGGLDRVFNASPEELMTVKGVKENAAGLICLVREICMRKRLAKEAPGLILSSVDAMVDYLVPRFMNCREEIVLLVCLDAKMKLLDCRQIGSGGLTSAHFSVRKIAQTALMHNAKYVVLSHNHTSGIALPSDADKRVTLQVRDTLAMMDIVLADHIIVAGEDFVSLSDDRFLA